MSRSGWIALGVMVIAVSALGAAQYTLTLVNEDWDRVTVQVREGEESSCEDRELIGERSLSKGQTWPEIPCGRPCWRKKLPGSSWGSWVSTSCFSKSETHEIN